VRNRLIDEGAGRTTANKVNGSIHLGRDAIRNLKNNVGFVLRKGAHPGDFVRLSVSDTGMGMDQETLKNLFGLERKQVSAGSQHGPAL
jgi:signal transduction histidine kinase